MIATFKKLYVCLKHDLVDKYDKAMSRIANDLFAQLDCYWEFRTVDTSVARNAHSIGTGLQTLMGIYVLSVASSVTCSATQIRYMSF